MLMEEQSIAIIVLFLRIGAVAALYGFLGWALWVLWQDLRAPRDQDISREFVVRIELSDLDNQQIHTFSIQQFTLGRDPTCDLQVMDSEVSTQHAQLSFHHGQWWLQDLESKNGTYLNHELVIEPVALMDGDVIGIGQMNYEVNLRPDQKEDRDPVYNDKHP